MRVRFIFSGLAVLFAWTCCGNRAGAELTVLFPVTFETSTRSPASFATTDGYTFPVTSLAFPAQFGNPSDNRVISALSPPYNETYSIPIDAGYRGGFGQARSYTVSGDTNGLQLPIDLSRLDPSSVYLRARGNPYAYEFGTPFLHNFDVNFVNAVGTTSIYSVPFNAGMGTAPVYKDIPLGGLGTLDTTTAIGKFTLDASMGMLDSAGHYRLDTDVAIAVKDPTIRGVPTLNQFSSPWAGLPYAQTQISQYLTTHPADPNSSRIEQDADNVTFGPVACAMTAYSMAFSALRPSQAAGFTPDHLLGMLETIPGGISEIQGVRTWKNAGTANEYPRFNGADANSDLLAHSLGFGVQSTADAATAAFNIAEGNPVLVRVTTTTGSHFMLATGASADSTGNLVFTGINPGGGRSFTKAASSIADYRIVSKQVTPGVIVQINSPVTATVTDPATGHQVKFDSVAGITTDTFGGSQQSITYPLATPDEYDANPDQPAAIPGYAANSIFLPNLSASELNIHLLGDDNGLFQISVFRVDANGISNVLFADGPISSGQELSYNATLIPEPAGLAILGMGGVLLTRRRSPRDCKNSGNS